MENGHDVLEGFRGRSDAEVEREFRERVGPDAFLIDLMRIGDHTRRFVTDNPAGRYLVHTLMGELHAAVLALLEHDDPGTAEARKQFFRARTAFKTVYELEDTIRQGVEAEFRLIDADRGEQTSED